MRVLGGGGGGGGGGGRGARRARPARPARSPWRACCWRQSSATSPSACRCSLAGAQTRSTRRSPGRSSTRGTSAAGAAPGAAAWPTRWTLRPSSPPRARRPPAAAAAAGRARPAARRRRRRHGRSRRGASASLPGGGCPSRVSVRASWARAGSPRAVPARTCAVLLLVRARRRARGCVGARGASRGGRPGAHATGSCVCWQSRWMACADLCQRATGEERMS